MERQGTVDRTSGRAGRRAARVGCLAVALAACGGQGAADPALRCAEFVKSYRGLAGGVEVVGTPAESSEGTVAIRWRGSDAENLPAEGSAECTFAVGGGGELTLLEASVDGAPVDEAAIEAARSSR
jgi:hypothetical protein